MLQQARHAVDAAETPQILLRPVIPWQCRMVKNGAKGPPPRSCHMSGLVQKQRDTAGNAATVDPDLSDAAADCSHACQDDPDSRSGEGWQTAAPTPRQSRVRTILKWAGRVMIVAVMAAVMGAWLILLAWVGQWLLALL